MENHNSDRERITLDEIATAAAAIVADTRAAGLTAPFTLTCYNFGQPAATFYLYDDGHDTPAIRAALQAWAVHFGTQVTTRPSTSPGSILAMAAFSHDGISYEVSAIIRPAPGDEPGPDQDQAA
jgi:hypothetical protein